MKKLIYAILLVAVVCSCKNKEEKPYEISSEDRRGLADFDTIPDQDSIPMIGREKYYSSKDSVACRKLAIEMGSGEECLIRNADFAKVYHDVLINERLEDTAYLMSVLPAKNETLNLRDKGKASGLISIAYTYKTADHLILNMSYEGGETVLDLKQLGHDVKRGIFHFAD